MWFNLAASGASDASDRDWWVKYRDLAAGLAKAIGATAFSRRLRCPKVRSLKTLASMSFSQFRSARDRRLAAIPRHPSLFPWTIRIRRWSYGNAASTGIEKDQTGSTCVFAAQSGSDRYLRIPAEDRSRGGSDSSQIKYLRRAADNALPTAG
jgi:hypothetical protein